jgi:hypothetical protein
MDVIQAIEGSGFLSEAYDRKKLSHSKSDE